MSISIDYDRLADVIKRHENSIRYPYGCHYRSSVDHKLHGYTEPVARAMCVKLCHRAYDKWVKLGMKGDYFLVLNTSYAEDTKWHEDVEKLYYKVTK